MWACYLVKVLFVISMSSFWACLNNLISFLGVGFYYSWFMVPCTQPDMHRKMTGKGRARNIFFFCYLSLNDTTLFKWKIIFSSALYLQNTLNTKHVFPNYKQNQFRCSLITLNQHVGPLHWKKKKVSDHLEFFLLKLWDASVRIYFNFRFISKTSPSGLQLHFHSNM